MKKKFTYLILALMVSAVSFAQTINIQGVPRKVNAKQYAAFQASEYGKADVDFNAIKRWIGSGDKQSALVIKWGDGKGGNKSLVWGYRWSSNADGTGEAMLRHVAQEDPSFYCLIMNSTQYGTTWGGFGYDLNGDGNIGLKKTDETEITIVGGITTSSTTDFDNYTSVDETDHWASGWKSGYWSYFVAEKSGDTFGYSNNGASQRILTNGCIDGWTFEANFQGDMTGELEYLPALTEYTDGRFIVNEDWYGHQNSTINFLDNNGEFYYRVFQKANPGHELGCTSQYATVYGDKLYIISKQAKDPAASITGGRITVCNAKTLKLLKQIENIATDDKGTSMADGRDFLGVDAHKGYVGTNNGIYILDLDTLGIKGFVKGTDNGGGSGYDQLYSGQIGNMVRVNNRVFAVHQKEGLLVIDPDKDEVTSTIAAPDKKAYGSVVLSKDGSLWLSVENSSNLVKVDPATLDTTMIAIPQGIYAPATSWYAWTPDAFCASTKSNVLYWNGGSSSWFVGKDFFKYDIDKQTFSRYIDLNNDADKWQLYGCSFRIDPVTDHAFASLFKDFSSQEYIVREYDNEGNKVKDYPMIENYWFPSIPVFTDNYAPVAQTLDAQTITGTDAKDISLKGIATDEDNMEAAMVKTIAGISDETVLKAEMDNGNLAITLLKDGKADITISINSNGKLTQAVVSITIETQGNAIHSTNAHVETKVVARYTLDGKLINAPQKGINILRMSDGTIKKVIVK